MPRIVTYNVHRCVGADRRMDVGRVAAVLADLRPDIVALQELDVGRRRTGHVDQAHEIARRLDMACHFHAALTVEEERYGDAILTGYPERLVKAAALPGYDRIRALEPRGALWVEVEIAGVPVQVINTHLGLVPREQQVQAAELLGLRWLGSEGFVGPAVLLGDFNALPISQTYRMFTAVLRDAQDGWSKAPTATFPSGFPILRIDHVFLSEGITVRGIESPFDPRSRVASDHLPLIVEVEVAGSSRAVSATAAP